MLSLYNPVNIFFGNDSLARIKLILDNKKYVVISSQGYNDRGWHKYFPNPRLVSDSVTTNPTVGELLDHIEILNEVDFDFLVAIGGGSVLDIAKASSILPLTSKKDILNILLNNNENLKKKFDVIAIPTTAGTGAEVTPFTTIWDDKNKKKLSLQSQQIYPKIALVDPQLALSLGLEMTAYSGLDALSHCFESLWNKNANPYSQSLAFSAINLILDSLGDLLNNLENLELRSKMAWASLLGGLCINQTKTAIAHSISYPLTSHFNIPHGLASGAFLPEIYDFNLKNDDSHTMVEIQKTLSLHNPIEKRIELLYNKLLEKGIFDCLFDIEEKIFTQTDNMIHPKRSKNNIVNITYTDIRFILGSFFKKQ